MRERTLKLGAVGLVVIVTALLAFGPAWAVKKKLAFTVGFDDLVNWGGWSFGNLFVEMVEPDGGNPGPYLRSHSLDGFAAEPRTLLGLRRTIFHGDYRSRGVSSVGIDLAVFSADSTARGRPLTVILLDDGDTPDDTSDDCRVYRVGGHPSPRPNGTWQPYRFHVPSQSTTLPQGWAVQGCPGLTEDEAWNRVITGVDQLRFFTGDPESFYLSQIWDIGLDNPTIVYEPPPLLEP